MSDYPCDQFDCPLHPVYIEEERKRIEEQKRKEKEEQLKILGNGSFQIGDIIFDSNNNQLYINDCNIATKIYTVDNTWSVGNIRSDEKGLKIDIPHVGSIDFTCFMCEHLKRCNMKEKVIIDKAKDLLSKK